MRYIIVVVFVLEVVAAALIFRPHVPAYASADLAKSKPYIATFQCRVKMNGTIFKSANDCELIGFLPDD